MSSQRQRAEQFDLLVERATDFAIFLLDPEGKVATWNEGARRILGYEEAEILGQNHADFYTPEDVAQGIPERQLQIAREQGKAENERWQRKKDGTLFYASGIDQALRDEAGNIRGYSIIFRDQTRQKQLEEALRYSEERFRSIVENVTDYALFTLDTKGTITEWNPGAEQILGYRPEEIIGQSGFVIFTPEDIARGEAEKELEQAAQEGCAEEERWHVRKDGSRFFASGVLMRMRDSTPPRFIKVLRDMTTHRQAEEERTRYQAQVAVLEERDRMAHELHDTLAQGFTGISLQLEAAKELLDTEPQSAEEHLNRASTLARESLKEARCVVKALRPALLQTQELPHALAHLVEQSTAGTSVTGEYVAVGTARTLLPLVEEVLLRTAQEALTNVLRHSGATQVKIELSFTTTSVQLSIEDNGQGFDTQAPVPDGHFGLRGIRERVQRLGGQVTLHSEVGQGTHLRVVIADGARKQDRQLW